MRKYRLSLVLLSVLLVVVLAAGCGGNAGAPGGSSSEGAQGDTIKIGFMGALTGNEASYGIETLKGMKMAAEDLNKAGGVLGKKIEIVESDHGSKQTEAASVVQKMISKDRVVAIVGDPTTGKTKLAAPICQQNKVVLLSAGAVGPGVVEFGDYIFRDTLLDAVAAPAVTKYLVNELGWKKVAIVTSTNNDYSVGLTKIFEEALAANNAQIVDRESIQDGDQDFSAQVTRIKQAKPDGIIFTGYYTEGGLFMKEVRKQGLDLKMAGGDGLLSPVLWKLGGDAVEGSMVYTGFAADPENAAPQTKEFIKKYQAANDNKLPDMFSAQGYDAVMLLAKAMKEANSTDPSKFKDALAKTKDYPGVSGTLTFLPNREPVKSPVYLLEVKNQQFSIKAALPTEAPKA
ncbi:ABC transporter substrate-binding protein [Desulfofundulus thermocisternus]|uniref:ABC transporter substrate-binding protein n=1 Tax=Desulfofundulus thermocisternus TaxID=42471 RepID=UPI001A0DF9A1|nr:ABC transporter substrate-binding protein [Desulfofundulus thermocisternus]MBE3585491.1 ABC transporter substrate-binding protein [Thermoanaerobacter sp.]MCS5696239.1 ABC transporter substrate-binding protein [Desulfofundulus thermocisternus]